MQPKHTCCICLGNFPQYLVENSVCLICKTRTDLENELLVERKKNVELKDKILLLETRLDSMLFQQMPKSSTNEVSLSEYSDFKKVRSNRSTAKTHKTDFNIKVSNRYEILEVDEEIKTVIIGDSQIRNLGSAIYTRKNENRKNSKKSFTTICYPGATTDFLNQRIDEFENNNNTDIVLHIGGNDIRNSEGKYERSEEILNKFKNLLNSCKEKCRKTAVISIIPRPFENDEWSSRAIGINNRMKKLCIEFNSNFIDLWDTFQDRSYFNMKGIHLNKNGTKKLSEVIYQHFSKPLSSQEN
jgi:hypothetical protein